MGDRAWCQFCVPIQYGKLVGYMLSAGVTASEFEDSDLLDLLFEPAFNCDPDLWHTETAELDGEFVELEEPEVNGAGYDLAEDLIKLKVPFVHDGAAYPGGWDAYETVCDGEEHSEWSMSNEGSGYIIGFDDTGSPVEGILKSIKAHILLRQKVRGMQYGKVPIPTPTPGSVLDKWLKYCADREVEVVKQHIKEAMLAPVAPFDPAKGAEALKKKLQEFNEVMSSAGDKLKELGKGLTMEDIVKVQPMTGPTGIEFKYEYVGYGDLNLDDIRPKGEPLATHKPEPIPEEPKTPLEEVVDLLLPD